MTVITRLGHKPQFGIRTRYAVYLVSHCTTVTVIRASLWKGAI